MMRNVLFMVVTVLLAGAGCAADRDADGKNEGDVADTAVQAIRGKGRARNQHDMHQLGLYYQMFDLDRGRPPADWNELKSFIGNEGPNIIRLVEDGTFIVLYKLKPRSDVVIAYEKEPSQGNRLVVALGDASVQILSPPELNQKLEEQAKPR
jgi:hypothetical protein